MMLVPHSNVQIIALLRSPFCLYYWQPTTPLTEAASFGHITTLQLLLDRGAKVDGKNEVRFHFIGRWGDQQHC